MLGLADRTRVINLFEALLRADIAAALAELRDQYDSGADPAMVLADLAEFTHFVTRVKIVPPLADDVSLTEAERTRGRAFAAKLSMRVLARTWQMLLKGIGEVEAAGRPIDAAEMVLVRIAYAADLPTPDEVIRSLGDTTRGNGSATTAAPARPELRSESPRGGARGPLASAAPATSSVPEYLYSRAKPPRPTPYQPSAYPSSSALFRVLSPACAMRKWLRAFRFQEVLTPTPMPQWEKSSPGSSVGTCSSNTRWGQPLWRSAGPATS